MHYSKHAEVKSQSISKKNGKIQSAIEKAEAIQQREHLRQMIIGKFSKDFGKGNKTVQNIIESIVNSFFETEKVTEESLRNLKTQVAQATKNIRAPSEKGSVKSDIKSQTQSQKGNQNIYQTKQQLDDDQKSKVSQSSKKSGATSDSSSMAPKSVYYVEGEQDDEWATLVKFDTQLFKKQKELQRIRQAQFKKKTKIELDNQIQQKQKRLNKQKQEHIAYNTLQIEQIKNYDRREAQKESQLKQKINLEKKMRDKQIKDQNKRKKNDKKNEDALDKMLVTKIQQELAQDQQDLYQRKEKQRQRLRIIMQQNQINQAKLKEEAEKQKQQDIRQQNQYSRLQKQLQDTRDLQKKQRQQKIKKIMSSYADTVIKDQKQQIRMEDEKMLKHIKNQIKKQEEDDIKRRQKQLEQQKDMRDFLGRQVVQKRLKQQAQQQINKLQADIWKQDLQNYKQHEENKASYIKDVNNRHQDILLAQMADKQAKQNRKKMNTLELLYNKALIKQASDNNGNIKKTNI